jgi:hypothetical protein
LDNYLWAEALEGAAIAHNGGFCNGCMTEQCIDKKANQIFILYKEIQSGAVAKS